MENRTRLPLSGRWMEGWTVSARLAETIVAVPAVMNARTSMIGIAAFSPVTGDWPKLYKKVGGESRVVHAGSLSITKECRQFRANC